jgi:hypothetical protein
VIPIDEVSILNNLSHVINEQIDVVDISHFGLGDDCESKILLQRSYQNLNESRIVESINDTPWEGHYVFLELTTCHKDRDATSNEAH